MQIEAIFENISEKIQEEISKAETSIYVAVAWFTNKTLFNELVKKAHNGCKISLLVSNDIINQNAFIDHSDLRIGTSEVYLIGNGDSELMHNKFCVIDGKVVITGSYNWSYKAQSNFENVVITYEDYELADQFIKEFQNIRKKYYPDGIIKDIEIPYEKIFKRLEILKNYILLEDLDEVDREISKIQTYEFNSEIKSIIQHTKEKAYGDAILKIQTFISGGQQLAVFNDPEVLALKLEIKILENQVNAFDNEKTELEKLLTEFHRKHTHELGDTILLILKLKKEKFKLIKHLHDEIEEDEKKYQDELVFEKEKQIKVLNTEEKEEIKKKFRKASIFCHPDKVSEEFIETAQEIFIELKRAYDQNDLTRVTEILIDLEKGQYFKSKSESINEKDRLRYAIAQLKHKIAMIESEIIELKESEAFKTISLIENWDLYFATTKETLQVEVENLKKELNIH